MGLKPQKASRQVPYLLFVLSKQGHTLQGLQKGIGIGLKSRLGSPKMPGIMTQHQLLIGPQFPEENDSPLPLWHRVFYTSTHYAVIVIWGRLVRKTNEAAGVPGTGKRNLC